jgi:hypothetical protein
MYLNEIQLSSETWFLLVGAFVLQFYILYQIIRYSVISAFKTANKDTIDQLKLLNQFKVRELLKNGVTPKEIQDDINEVFPSGQPIEVTGKAG